jgi:hypothetical protein
MPLAPWCSAEQWTFGVDGMTGRKFAVVTGRNRCPANLRANPLWWWRNDYEQQLPDWYESDKPLNQRLLDWSIRNPFSNGNMFVWGIADRNYRVDTIEGWDDPLVVQRDDVIDPETGKPGQGYQRAKLTLDDGTVKTWTSYCNGKLVYSYGWQPTGIFELKLNWLSDDLHVSASLAHTSAQANGGKPAGHGEAHSSTGERYGRRASSGRGR